MSAPVAPPQHGGVAGQVAVGGNEELRSFDV